MPKVDKSKALEMQKAQMLHVVGGAGAATRLRLTQTCSVLRDNGVCAIKPHSVFQELRLLNSQAVPSS